MTVELDKSALNEWKENKHETPKNMSTSHHQILAQASYQQPEKRHTWLSEKLGTNYGQIVKNTPEFFTMVTPNELFNVHRGSVTYEDWASTDVGLAVGNLESTDRYKRALRNSMDAVSQFGNGRNTTEIGHSLGGSLAETIGQQTNHESTVFNQGTTTFKDYTKVNRKRHRHYRIENDIVSQFDTNTETTHLKPRKKMPRLLDPFRLASPVLSAIGDVINSHLISSFNFQ